MSTLQQSAWAAEFGKEYTHRNSFIDKNGFNFDDWNNLLFKEIGITRTSLNKLFFNELEADSVLEVGSNMGLQLNCFEKMKLFSTICGLEIQRGAISKSRKVFSDGTFDIMQGIAEDLPFKDLSFDLVVINGLLIHISPDNLDTVLGEIYRCSKKYIFGYEYYGDVPTSVNYRGRNSLLWRANFCAAYLNKFPDLRVVKQKRYVGTADPSNLYDTFLLEKAI